MRRRSNLPLRFASLRRRTAPYAAILAMAMGWVGPAWSSGARATAEAQSLDQQVQDIKSEVLAIAAELRALEEQLLHPSSTQVSVFVEIQADEDVLVDAARLVIDGETVAHHVYTHQELQALRNGGVQRLFTGNLREGEHALRIELEGRRGSSGRFEASQEAVVQKAVGPKKVGITLAGALTGGARVDIQDW